MPIRLFYLPLVVAYLPLTCIAASTFDNLYARQAALKQAEQDYQLRATALTEGDSKDFLTYIGNLQEQLIQECAELQWRGIVVPADIDCPDQPASGSMPAQFDSTEMLTETEQAAALDAELESGLGDFDELLLREQARVKTRAPRTVGSESGQFGSAADSAATDAGSAEADKSAQDSDLEKPPVVSTSTGEYSDGSDDDVVARQLRQAAEQETDPELKKKLWEEYRKYKQGTQSQ